jgi:hypothetical protein
VLGDPSYEYVDTDGDGYADFLLVKVWVNPTVAGNYILAGDLVGASGTNRFSQSAAFAADGTGPMQVTLIFDLSEIRAAGGSGSYHIENLQLFEQTSNGTAWLDAYRGMSVVTISGFFYTTTNGTITITGYTGTNGTVVIPNTLNNLPVTRIGDWAFANCTCLTGVYFNGNAPSLGGSSVFSGDNNATVYYLPGTTGWNPQIQTSDASFGVRTNRFGFTIIGTSGLAIVVEACTNLANATWVSLQSCTLTNGSLYFSDPRWTN